MTFWTFLAVVVLIFWFWLCPLLILVGIASLIGKKGKEVMAQWERQHQAGSKASTTS